MNKKWKCVWKVFGTSTAPLFVSLLFASQANALLFDFSNPSTTGESSSVVYSVDGLDLTFTAAVDESGSANVFVHGLSGGLAGGLGVANGLCDFSFTLGGITSCFGNDNHTMDGRLNRDSLIGTFGEEVRAYVALATIIWEHDNAGRNCIGERPLLAELRRSRRLRSVRLPYTL